MSEPPHALTDGYVDAAGHRIHYVEKGSGFPLLLIHGAFGSGTNFLQNHLGSYLAEHFHIIAPDSLAHGESDAPNDPALYGARQRALNLASVLDALDIDRAHVVGYSMGGWMASALATHHPERIASLSIGGWDVVKGMYTPAAAWGLPEITYDILGAMVRRDRPDMLDWLQPENESALAAAVNGMNDLTGLAEGVADCPAPVALFMGKEDLYFNPTKQFAADHDIPFLPLPGDHISLIEQYGAEAGRQISDFIARRKP
ncbi:alpha/beta fold hydrolase [Emcibacter sp.]|uniref:alpha/beta fold hydrolase n=1 Tax=Emcibacter sp. TaxID=1979954 RepID=UPI003A940B1D